jgi:hypothetical protein
VHRQLEKGGWLEKREECDDAVAVARATIHVRDVTGLFRFTMDVPFESTHTVFISLNQIESVSAAVSHIFAQTV